MTTDPFVRTGRDAILYVPEGFTGPPTDTADAIARAAALIQEEGRWGKGRWLCPKNRGLDEYRQDPFCNGWWVCAEGALQLVVIGVRWDGERPLPLWLIDETALHHGTAEAELFQAARTLVVDAIDELYGVASGKTYRKFMGGPFVPGWGSIPPFNDHFANRDQVVAALNKAADNARAARTDVEES